VFFCGFVKTLDFRGWISYGLILQDGLGPRMTGVFVEVAAVKNHKVDVFAHVDLGDDAVGGGRLRAVLDGFAEFGFSEGLGLFGENFF